MRSSIITVAPWLTILSLAAGCAGAAGTTPRPPVSNLSAGSEPSRTGPAPRQPVILWCTTPDGLQCGRAERQLGVRPTATAALAPQLFESDWRDLEDDCADPDLAALLATLSVALAVPDGGWVDQGGNLTLDGLGRVSHGGGCTNLTNPGVTDVKVQLVDTGTGLVAVVRVWELDETQ